jgi:hypothetical protein
MSGDLTGLMHIGFICVAWAELENKFSQTIWATLRVDIETGKIITGGLDMVPRANMAINLARHKKAPRYIIKALERARKQSKMALTKEGTTQSTGCTFLPMSQLHDTLRFNAVVAVESPGCSPTRIFRKIGEDITSVSTELREPFRRWLVESKGPLLAAHMAAKIRSAAEETGSESGS